MNARQKAKKLKKELEYIKSLPKRINVKTTYIPTERLRAYRVISFDEIERHGKAMMDNEVRVQLSRDLANIIRERLVINETEDLARPCHVRYTTDVWIGFGGDSE